MLIITDTSNIKDNSQTQFGNKSVNERNFDTKDKDNNRDNRDNRDDKNLGEEHSKTKEETSFKVLK